MTVYAIYLQLRDLVDDNPRANSPSRGPDGSGIEADVQLTAVDG